MGWSMSGDREIFTTEEMIEAFSWDRMSLGGPVFDLTKLSWLNGQYMNKLSDQDYLKRLRAEVFSDDYLLQIIPLIKARVNTFEEFIGISQFFFWVIFRTKALQFLRKDVTARTRRVGSPIFRIKIELLDTGMFRLFTRSLMDYLPTRRH